MLHSSKELFCAVGKEVSKRGSTMPVLSPAVIRSLYRRLYKEVSFLDTDALAKFLFPCTRELQELTGIKGPLYVPGKKYVNVLREVFRDAKRIPKVNLAFDTLNRLRAHRENVRSKMPGMIKERDALLNIMKSQEAESGALFRAAPLVATTELSGPRYEPATPLVPTRVVLREPRSTVDLSEGVVLVAHPLSSTHVDRRVMMITERTPLVTSAVVLDLQFTYPLSRGNPMFPEVFWGHDVYDGGFSQIGFTMPPTAQITLLHTLEPGAELETTTAAVQTQAVADANATQYLSWRKWIDLAKERSTPSPSSSSQPSLSSSVGGEVMSASRREHQLLCRPLIIGGTLPDGTKEPTLYLSRVEALPYLARLAAGQPRSSLRVYWGSMRWSTAQIEQEVFNGHWVAVRVSPSFFRPYSLLPPSAGRQGQADVERFPTNTELDEARRSRERRYGADVSLPQAFPPDQLLRRRECLWDEIMYALGGEYVSLVGCSNPFASQSRWAAVPQILAPLAVPVADDAVNGGENDSGAIEAAMLVPDDEDEADLVASLTRTGVPASETAPPVVHQTTAAEETGKTPEHTPPTSTTKGDSRGAASTTEGTEKGEDDDSGQTRRSK